MSNGTKFGAEKLWQAGIVVGFMAFAVGVLVLVYIAMRQNVDLVTDNYYAKELKHEEQIQRVKRAAEMMERVQIVGMASMVAVKFPVSLERAKLAGRLEFYRPADQSKDFAVPVSVDSTNVQIVPLASLAKGLWRVKVRWIYNGVEYYNEEPIIIE